MDLMKQLKPRPGFTLVEVIVVLVILAILAAIGIPALTGYINKARDQEWEMKARDINLAVRSVLKEEYAAGNIKTAAGSNHTNIRYWSLGALTADGSNPGVEASALMGREFQAKNTLPGYWNLQLCSPKSNRDALKAEGFILQYYTKAVPYGKRPVVVVTYRLNRLNVAKGADYHTTFYSALQAGTYNAKAGYEVYHIIYNGANN
ncbi:MAG: prepilin-type N-terminal cleavage/methylation domain-containing protein [Clostridiales Family XIII bacterium]|jgi:type IV pilus assembly protein PilA|nr:prepilin-type N-terminal cleavage/methylation domain-containing protein [Clostridiales Family XIII bacterium]